MAEAVASAHAQHIPVLLDETVTGLNLGPGSRAIDGTLGGGGHTALLLERTAPDGRVLGLDADPEAVQRVKDRLAVAVTAGRLLVVQANFGALAAVAHAHGFEHVDGIVLDLGVSSFQLESPARGFSLMAEGPLDMRFDPTQAISAAEIVNTWQERDLADLIYRYGEDRQSRRIARYLVAHRPVHTTQQLAQLVERAVGGRRGERIHPATRTFQALRIVVNQELAQLETALAQSLDLLRRGGRIAVISFHSLEDRIVKQWMQAEARDFIYDRAHPFGGEARTPTLRVVTPKPITPSLAEVERNARSRSAKLRIAERL
jgi:16S rRNA (cytosine1402-N4)-methyltransferase